MSVNLQYNYAQVDPETGRCRSCGTYSYEVPLYYYIPVDDPSNDYIGKYYNFSDEKWYYDAEFTEEVVEFNN